MWKLRLRRLRQLFGLPIDTRFRIRQRPAVWRRRQWLVTFVAWWPAIIPGHTFQGQANEFVSRCDWFRICFGMLSLFFSGLTTRA